VVKGKRQTMDNIIGMGCKKMDKMQGKHFSITDPKGVNTVIYQINKTEKEFLDKSPKYTVERLDHTEELRRRLKQENFLCG